MRPVIRSTLALAAAALAASAPLGAQTTRAERTAYAETSTYADMVAFLDSLQRRGAELRIGTLAESPGGRVSPYVIVSRPLVVSAAEARRSGKPIVWLQGNIHAGEVEGKEVAQMLLRDLTVGALRPLLDSLVLIVVPMYNTDGNERIASGEENRPGQNGPARVGQRTNGQGLDLNRDYMKQEAPETRGTLALVAEWDPHLFVDMHTTNGSYHGYALTYSPGLNPNDNPANAWVRDRFLPEIRERVRRRHRHETFPYGNLRNQEPDSLTLGWETYDARPRFGTNLMGLRGRLSVLSEAYSNDPFAKRVDATYDFVREVLALTAERADTVLQLVRASDRHRTDSVIVQSVLAPPTTLPVIVEITTAAGDGSHGYARRNRTGEFRTIRMPVYDRFAAARKEAMPAAYLLPPQHAHVVELLRRQGVQVARLSDEWRGAAERFTIDSVSASRGTFEGHRLVAVQGQWRPAAADSAAAGWYLVRTDQPLGVLAAYTLEPASEDGAVAWNYMDRDLRPGATYPFIRTRETVAIPSVIVP
jgi:hypothetical protein